MKGAFRTGRVRPESLLHSFFLERKIQKRDSRGAMGDGYDTDHPEEIRAILAGASPREALMYQQASHPVTHVITHRGRARAKTGDRLIFEQRAFYVQGVDTPGNLGVWTLYYCEERQGTHNGHHS